jgi:hypothetical protein
VTRRSQSRPRMLRAGLSHARPGTSGAPRDLAASSRPRCRLTATAREGRRARASRSGARSSVAMRGAGGRRHEAIAFIGAGQHGAADGGQLCQGGPSRARRRRPPEAVEAAVAQGPSRPDPPPRPRAGGVRRDDGPNSPEVEVAYPGTVGGAGGRRRRGQIAIDMSTIDPATTARSARRLDAAGVRMLDAPVSGGVPGAVAGTLTIMVGAIPPCLPRRAHPGCDGKNVVHVGPLGSGEVAKICNNSRRRVDGRGGGGLHDRDPGGGRPEDPPRGDPDQLGELLGARAQLPVPGLGAQVRVEPGLRARLHDGSHGEGPVPGPWPPRAISACPASPAPSRTTSTCWPAVTGWDARDFSSVIQLLTRRREEGPVGEETARVAPQAASRGILLASK